MPLRDLDALTVWHEGRLEKDVENVQNMATVDMVELMLNTRYSPDRIVEWVDQAILYTQLESSTKSGNPDTGETDVQKLKKYGICKASALVKSYQADKRRRVKVNFENVLTDDNGSRIPSIVDSLETYPNLGLIQHWNGSTGK